MPQKASLAGTILVGAMDHSPVTAYHMPSHCTMCLPTALHTTSSDTQHIPVPPVLLHYMSPLLPPPPLHCMSSHHPTAPCTQVLPCCIVHLNNPQLHNILRHGLLHASQVPWASDFLNTAGYTLHCPPQLWGREVGGGGRKRSEPSAASAGRAIREEQPGGSLGVAI